MHDQKGIKLVHTPSAVPSLYGAPMLHSTYAELAPRPVKR